MSALPFALLAITHAVRDTLESDVRAWSRPAARVAVLLRDPMASEAEYARCARRLAPICADAGAAFLLHGLSRLPLAGEPGVRGIHLPERDSAAGGLAARTGLGERALVGVSRHDASGLFRAAHADYATLAPVFAVPGKGAPLGLDVLRAACARRRCRSSRSAASRWRAPPSAVPPARPRWP